MSHIPCSICLRNTVCYISDLCLVHFRPMLGAYWPCCWYISDLLFDKSVLLFNTSQSTCLIHLWLTVWYISESLFDKSQTNNSLRHIEHESETYQSWDWDNFNMSLTHIEHESETYEMWAWDISNMSLRHIKHETETYWTWVWHIWNRVWDISNMSLTNLTWV